METETGQSELTVYPFKKLNVLVANSHSGGKKGKSVVKFDE